MSRLRRAVLILVPLLILAGVVVYLRLDGILKTTVERETTTSLNLNAALQSARLSLFGGKVNLHQFHIASPRGFSAPHMLALGDVDLSVKYGQLRKDPIHVESLTLNQPRLVIEQSNGTMNFKRAMDLMPKHESSSKPIKLIIDELKIQDAQVVIHPGLPGLAEEITVPVPSMSLNNVGSGNGSQNGAAIKDVAMQVITALATSAAASGSLPAELKGMLHANVADVAGKLGAEAQKQIAAAIPGEFGNKLSKMAADPEALAKDPSKVMQQRDIGGILGGNTTPPSAGRAAPKKR
jgi:uncharacterized protein involved in outer membrane biogenesis